MAARLALTLLALISVGVSTAASGPSERWRDLGNGVSVLETGAAYKATSARPQGWFQTGQAADIALAAIGFNDTGGPLLFNHPGGIASDGTHLLLADRNNNRVLVWNRLPTANTKPDLVLGQRSFRTNGPGSGLAQMNWPVTVAAAGGKVVVADTSNDRLLIWTRFPTRNAQPADLVIRNVPAALGQGDPRRTVIWPWGVWTDGHKLAASITGAGLVLIWNSFPARTDQPADLVLKGGGDVGTPRSITSNGKSLLVGDHNPRGATGRQGSWVWKTWPVRDDQPYDYFLPDPVDARGAWLSGAFGSNGELVLVGTRLYVWRSLPSGPEQKPDLVLEATTGRPLTAIPKPADLGYFGGDGSGAAVAGGRLYLSLANWNHVLGFRRLPTSPRAKPDFTIGAANPETNTLLTSFFVTNGVPTTNGNSLFVSSDFDGRLSVYKQLPAESGAHPDLVYRLPKGGSQSALHGNTFVIVGTQGVLVWKSLPLGQAPDAYFQHGIGSVTFRELRGVALDDRHLYLADKGAGKIYVWDGIPSSGTEPAFALDAPGVTRLSSDGVHLVATRTEARDGARVWVYDIAGLSAASASQDVRERFNLPGMALGASGALFVAETPMNRVWVWRDLADALAGKSPDVILGMPDLTPRPPSVARNRLFWPGALAFDGSYLWVGEFKFSGRLLRYSVR